MTAIALVWIADGLVLAGLVIMTVAVYGLLRMPDTYTRLHAASKAGFLGVLPMLVALVLLGNGEAASRALLVALFLLLTTPVSAHAIARAAYRTGERMQTPGAVDESGPLLREE